MPFQSKAQMRYLYSQEPKIAEEWTKKYGVPNNLPETVSDRRGIMEKIARPTT